MIAEIRDMAGRLLGTANLSPRCNEHFCDTCGDCLVCYADDCERQEPPHRARWIVEIDSAHLPDDWMRA